VIAFAKNYLELMNKYIALLRGINVSGQKKIKMTDLQMLFELLNFSEVETYIQSGNVIFLAKEKKKEVIGNKITAAIEDNFGFQVDVIVVTPKDFESLIINNPFVKKKKDIDKLYVVFLSNVPSKENLKKLDGSVYLPEEFVIDEKYIYLFVPNGYGSAKLNNNFFENKLKVSATTRNWKTVKMLFDFAS
jgi:uncharacterized protein (DUF1697 family)